MKYYDDKTLKKLKKKQYLEFFVICHDVEMILKKFHLILNVFYTLFLFIKACRNIFLTFLLHNNLIVLILALHM